MYNPVSDQEGIPLEAEFREQGRLDTATGYKIITDSTQCMSDIEWGL